MKIVKIFFVIIITFYTNSCDILRSSPFEVTSWSPGGGYHSEPEKIVVSAEFSGDPDRASVERYFSLTADSGRVKGIFQWEGRKVTFVPLSPLEKNTDYTLNITADAHDTEGLSMDMAFDRRFSTRPGTERPILLSCYPELYAEVGDARTEVKLSFSLPLQLKTLYDNVSFNPSMTGSWRLEADGCLAVFTPSEPWMQNSRYELRFSGALTDNKEMNAGKDFTSIFTIGTDHEAPYLLCAYRIAKDGEITTLEPDESGYIGALQPFAENPDWEKEDRLSLVFSKPVDAVSVKNCLSVDDASALVMETPSGFESEYIFHFDNIPVFESRFVFRIKSGIKDRVGNESEKEYIYRIFANGKYSKPPKLVGIRLPMAPANEREKELVSFGTDALFDYLPITDENYPSTRSTETWIELYFDTAQDAVIDTFSLMELFRVETSNNVLTFSPRQIKTDDFSVSQPYQEWKDFYRLEIKGFLINSVNFGIVNFQIASGLKDSLGNKAEKIYRITLVK